MPIYDNDGTAKVEVGKLYDNDGTANHQIGKAYDHDGTAASLVYSGDANFGKVELPATYGASSGSTNSGALDMSGYSTLSGHAYCRGGVTSGSTSIGSYIHAYFYVKFGDSEVLLTDAEVRAYNGDSYVIVNAPFEVDISTYDDEQKKNATIVMRWTASNNTITNGLVEIYCDNLIAQ